MQRARIVATIIGGLAVGVLPQVPASAAVISVVAKQALTSIPFVASFGGGAGTLSFTAFATGYGPGAAVATGGNALVAGSVFGLGDYSAGTEFDGSAQYAAYPSPTGIEFSAADDYIGFTYAGVDGTHYGYAELFGPTLVGYAYESTANTNITANPVPEPASVALVLGGLAGVGMIRRRKRNAAAA